MSRRLRARKSCSSTHTTYASRSTAPWGGSAFAYTALRQRAGTSLSSTSRGSSGFSDTFRRDRAG